MPLKSDSQRTAWYASGLYLGGGANHRYDTSGQALNPGSVASYGVLYLPPSAGLFD